MMNQLPEQKITCPRCGHNQPAAVECVSCGVIIEKASSMLINIGNNKEYLLDLVGRYRDRISSERTQIYPNISIEVLEEAFNSYSKQSLWVDWNSSRKTFPPSTDLDEEVVLVYSNNVLNNRASCNILLSTCSLYYCDTSIRSVCSSVRVSDIRIVKVPMDRTNVLRINGRNITINGIKSNDDFLKNFALFFNDMARDYYFASKNKKTNWNMSCSQVDAFNDRKKYNIYKTEGVVKHTMGKNVMYLMTIKDKSGQNPDGKFDVFGVEKKLIKMNVGSGIIMILLSSIWFLIGLRYDRIFLYPPVLFVIGVYILLRGVFNVVKVED